MPEITCRLGAHIGFGRNKMDRPSQANGAVIKQIRRISGALETFLSNIKALERSAFSCAEVEALADLLSKLPAGSDYSQIEFSIAVGADSDGKELWEPCANCLQWLEAKSGFGSARTYRLNPDVLKNLPSKVKVAEAPQFDFSAWQTPAEAAAGSSSKSTSSSSSSSSWASSKKWG